MSAPLLEVRGVFKDFEIERGFFARLARKGRRNRRNPENPGARADAKRSNSVSDQDVVRAVAGVDFTLERGETLAIVGESGSGKTTLGRCVTRLLKPDRGEIIFDGQNLAQLTGADLRRWRRRIQMVFQDPLGSLDPRQRIASAIAEPIRAHRLVAEDSIDRRVEQLLDRVSLDRGVGRRLPHELSGGQRQRVAIARVLAAEPDIIVADEPVSALDVSVRSQVINLLVDLQSELDLGILFIAHDLSLIERMSPRIAVMYQGRFVETGPARQVLSAPAHPYTIQLVDSVPNLRPRQPRRGHETTDISPALETAGCSFADRCPIAEAGCRLSEPALTAVAGEHASACFLPQAVKTLNRDRGNLSQSPT